MQACTRTAHAHHTRHARTPPSHTTRARHVRTPRMHTHVPHGRASRVHAHLCTTQALAALKRYDDALGVLHDARQVMRVLYLVGVGPSAFRGA